MTRRAFSMGMAILAVAIGAGAFGAHGLSGTLTPEALGLWETAARYLGIAALAVVAVGLAAERRPQRSWDFAAWALISGGGVFAVTVGALALGGPRWLGAVTPIGGVGMILGCILAAWTWCRVAAR